MLKTLFRRRPLIEELEPRLLYSADLAPLVLDGMQPAPEQRVITATGEYASQTAAIRHELIIVDSGVKDHETLLADILMQSGSNRQIEVMTLDTSRDGVEQITEILRQQSSLDALHIISHGESGSLQLGKGLLNADTLKANADDFAVWEMALSEQADILLYGCDVAFGEAGKTFIDRLSQLTGADVAASNDRTGNAAQGGDWVLETTRGTLETGMLLGNVQTVWSGTLNIIPEAGQTSVNDTNPNAQDTTPSSRQVAMHSDGSFVVVWISNSQDGSGNGVYLRRFDSSGNALTGEIQVNTTTSDNQQAPAIAMDASGNFVVVWQSEKQESGGGNTWGIFAQRFDANGNKLGGEFQVNTTVSKDQTSPSIGMDAAGNFVVAWESQDQDGDSGGIYAQRFDNLGNKIQTAGEYEFQVNSVIDHSQSQPAVAMNASGAFVIVWTSAELDGSGNDGVAARLFDAAGNTIKSEFKFHPLPFNDQHSPDVAMNDNGEFVIALVDEFWGNPNIAVWAFDAAGTRQGIGAQVNQYSTGIQQSPSVATNASGDFVVAWESEAQDGDGYGIVARHFRADYTAYADEQIINTVTSANQSSPGIAWQGNQAVIIWSGFGTEDSQGVYLRQAEINTPPVITSNGGGSTASLSVAENTTAITTVAASDADVPAQTLTYSLTGGTDQAKFNLDPATGALTFIAAPDYDTPGDANGDNVYQVIVQVDDGHGGSDTQTINVTVANAAPIAQDDAYATSQDTALTVPAGSGLLNNDADPAGGALSVLSVTQPGHGTVSLVPSAITAFTNLTNNSAVDTRADWSPDGSKIAFDTDRNTSGKGEIYVMNASGSGLARLTNNSYDDTQAAWSPDGSKIAWMSNSSGKYEVWVMNADGSNKQQLTTTSGGAQVSGQPAWSPDGSKIAFTSSRTGSSGYDIYVMNANGSNVVKLTTASGDDSEPVWSPDGSKIAFYSNRDGNTEIYVMNADGSSQTRLTSSSSTDRSPVWSPDGSKIAFASNRSGTYQIYMMDTDGSNQTQVTSAATDVTFPDWAPNSNKLLFTISNEIRTANVVFDGSFIYTPDAGYTGTDSFTYTVTDASGLASTATVTLNITSPNTAPVTSPVTLAAMTEDTDRVITQAELLANASDADGDTLTATGLAISSGAGLLVDNGDGTWTYTPALNDASAVSFSYAISDGNGGSTAGSATLDITPVNDAPATTPVTLAAMAEDSGTRLITQAELLAAASDADSDPLTATGLSINSGSGGLVDNGDGTWTYTPALNDASAASFSYSVTDGSLTAAGTATLDITPVNDAPATSPVTLAAMAEDTIRVITQAQLLANASDIDGPSLTATGLAISSGSGSLLNNGDGTWTYTPALNDAASVSFSYSVTDGSLTTAGTATLDITPVNDAPTAASLNIDVPINLLYSGTLPAATDVEGDSISYALASPAANGVATVNTDGTFSYLPVFSYFGSDSFTYTVSDGNGGSNSYTITINVGSVNSAPTASDDSVGGNEDNPLSGNVLDNDSDVDGNPLTAALVSGPASGSLILNANGSFTYTPSAQFNGTDSFTYKANDGALDSNVATVTLTVTSVNDAPATSPVALAPLAEDTNRLITQAELLANASDIDGPSLTATGLAISSGSGSLLNNGDGTWTYTPTLNDNTSVSFSYTVTDGSLTAAGSATLDITPVNDAPTFTSTAATTATEDTPYSYSISVTDPDGGSLSITASTLPGWLTLTDNGNGTATLSGTPGNSQVGDHNVVLEVSDGSLAGTQSFTLTVTNSNDAPVASNFSFETQECTLYNGNLPPATDADGDTVTYSLATAASHGSVTVNADGSFSYEGVIHYYGSDSFSFTVSDGNGGGNTYTVSVNITPVNDAPSGADSTVTITEDSVYTFQPGDFGFSDADDSPADSLLAIKIVSLPSAGTLLYEGIPVVAGQFIDAADIALGELQFVPAADDNGAGYASFTFQVQDSGGTTDGGVDLDPVARTLTIDVTPVNDAPEASDDNVVTDEDVPVTLNVITNDTDLEAQALSVTAVTQGANGTVTFAGESVTYTPDPDFYGDDNFTYTVSDGNGGTDTAMVYVTVNPANDQPSFVSVPATSATEDAAYSYSISATDIDGDPLIITAPALPGWMTLTDNGDGTATLTGTPTQAETGSHSIMLQVSDGSLAGTQSFTLAVGNTNDAPTVANAIPDQAATEDAVFNFQFAAGTFNDVDTGDSLTYSASGLPVWLSFDAATRTFTGTPVNSDVGIHSITVRAADGPGAWTEDSFDIVVANVNDAPAGADGTVTIVEDTSYTFQTSDFGFSDPNDSPADSLLAVKITSLPSAGTLLYEGSPVVAGQIIGAADIALNELQFVPAANATGISYTSFRFQVQDDGGTSSGGIDLDPAPRTLTIDVTPVNDAPSLTISTLNVAQGETVVLSGAQLQATDVDNTASELTYVVTATPAEGTLALNGVALAINDTFTQADIDAGLVTYTHTSTTATPDSLGLKVVDPASAEASGVLTLSIQAPAPNPVEAGAPMPDPEAQPAAQPPSESAPPAEEVASGSVEPFTGPLTEDEDDKEKASGIFEEDGENSFADAYRRASSLNPVQVVFNSYLLQNESPATTSLLTTLNRALDAIASDLNALESLKASLGNNSFQQQLNQLQDEIRQQLSLDKNTVASSLAISTGLSVGYVLWLVRGGVLLSSLLSSLPAWRLIDPLPILAHLNRQKHGDDEDDSLEGMLKKSAVKPRPSAPSPEEHAS